MDGLMVPTLLERFMVTKDQIRDARLLLRWSMDRLGKESGVGKTTVQRLETEEGGVKNARYITVMTVIRTLEQAGIEFLPDGSVRRR
jgi:hypothetical protein